MEPGVLVPAELKLRRPSQRARIPAPFFAHPHGAAEPAEPPGPDPAEAEADFLVPTHDEWGRPIHEWKRQVMVRRLRARLVDQEELGGQDEGSWSFSPSRQAMLGPFGELLTEADLQHLERTVESLRLRRRGEAYQSELRRLARELRALLPAPLLSITVRSPPPAPGQPLPLWCGRLAGAVSSLAAMLAHAEGARVSSLGAPPAAPPAVGQPRETAGSLAQREIRQYGVCVRSLRGAFEPPWGAPEEKAGGGKGTEAASDSGISCEEGFSDGGGGSPGPGPEWGSLRKERIVMLFLSHWKRSSACGPSFPAPGDPREAAATGEWGTARLARQREAIQRLLGGWREAASRRPPPPPPPTSALLSPEQFVVLAGGKAADYDSLSLELFMLGYFRILEQELSPEERRGRHLLCFEVFEQLGRHGWHAVRAFHRAVTDEIAAGRRGWQDGFEDIKEKYFGSSQNSAWRLGEAGGDGEEICRYIDRSFAFWKEKEAEIFSLEE